MKSCGIAIQVAMSEKIQLIRWMARDATADIYVVVVLVIVDI